LVFTFFDSVDCYFLCAAFGFLLSSTMLIVNAWHDVFFAGGLGASLLLHFLPLLFFFVAFVAFVFLFVYGPMHASIFLSSWPSAP